MLPIYKDMIFDLQQIASIQLLHLESPSYQLKSDTQNHILKMYELKKAQNAIFIDVCNKWREQSPSIDQFLCIAQIERNVHALDLIYEEILHFLSKLSKNTIETKDVSDAPVHLNDFESILNGLTEPLNI